MNKQKRPNFIIAGFPKCGSTALHYYLENHPQIYMPKQKELHYFTSHILSKLNNGPGDKETKIWQLSNIDDYENCFKNAKPEQVIGEASPSYINYPCQFDTIKEELNNPKVIIILRDPIKRAYSNYLHLVREHREDLSFYEALLNEDERVNEQYSDFWYYKFNSTYFDKIQQACKKFEKVTVLTQEELNKDTKATMKKIFTFLGVEDSYVPDNIDQRYNHGGVFKDNFTTRFFFKQTKFKSIIKKTIPIPVQVKNVINKVVGKYRVPTPEIEPKTEEYLVQYFKEDVQNLKNFGVNVSLWNKNFF
ncbi:sulfotransferase family protein [Corallibacter sp.]|uniref:sulfotransferase family protein n=1 Tax=Corallibacter sp. TaxID=2038084 RepID=UPI003AB6A4AB